MPVTARLLGLSGLLPQWACLAVLVAGPEGWHYWAISIAAIYAAAILSFLGGMWWGLAASASFRSRVPAFVWFAAVTPTLVAVAAMLPWIFGYSFPGPSLWAMGGGIGLSVAIDAWLRRTLADVPQWWLALRIPLSTGLSVATMACAWLA